MGRSRDHGLLLVKLDLALRFSVFSYNRHIALVHSNICGGGSDDTRWGATRIILALLYKQGDQLQRGLGNIAELIAFLIFCGGWLCLILDSCFSRPSSQMSPQLLSTFCVSLPRSIPLPMWIPAHEWLLGSWSCILFQTFPNLAGT